jgi:hypothetical protein
MFFIELTERAWQTLLDSRNGVGAASLLSMLSASTRVTDIRWTGCAFVLIRCTAPEAAMLLESCEGGLRRGGSADEIAGLRAAADAVRAGIRRGEW